LYASSNIIRLIKSRRIKCAGLVICLGKMRNTYSILVVKPEDWMHVVRDMDSW
jgi:hypothetical protein